MKNIRQKMAGFTIIEVLIVLAIAGLILLIVFLAVPALQRNSRNTQRRNDISGLLGSVQEHINNNNGALPTTVAQVTANARLGFYPTGNISLVTCTSSSCPAQDPTTDDHTIFVMHAQCPATVPGTGSVTLTYGNRSYAAVFEVETATGSDNECQQS